jgi:ATP-dependent protease ClpP protease subunit/phage major head subunit gpT-like protein
MTNEIHLYGTVGASFWDEEYFTPKTVRDMLAGREGPLTVRLNSGGGIATDGQAIYTMLKDYPGEVEVVVDGVAASAGSLIAMAGDSITMRLGSWLLIHDPSSFFTDGRGTAEDHRELAGFLDKVGDAYAEVYAARAGLTAEAARDVMRAESVFLGSEAVEAGFATHYEGNEQAAAAAAFDYRIYANAPESVRQASERLGEKPGQMALAAFMAGRPRNAGKEPLMADSKKAAAGTPTAEIEAPEQMEANEVSEQTQTPEVVVEANSAPRATISAAQVSKLYQVGAKLNVPIADVAATVEKSTDFEAALDALSDKIKAKGDVDTPMHAQPTARILRDERETMREGMSQALVAQIARRDPETDQARPYMTMSLTEMAAQSIGHRGPIRHWREREDVLMQAMHSTSDFPHIFENALNKELASRYADAQPTYRAIARRKTFNDFRPHPVVRAGDWPELAEIGEGGEIQFGTFSEAKETVAVKSYARAVSLSRQMLINDDLDAISQVIADQGRAVARFEDKTFYAMMLSGSSADGPTLLETTRQVFNTTDNSKAGSNAAINKTSLSVARASMRKRTGIDGAALSITPAVLLVGPDKETEAQSMMAQITAAQSSEVNPFSGTMMVVTTAYITGNAWYVFANPMDVANFVYGYLSGYEAPRMRMDEPFGIQGVRMSLEHDFGVGAIDHRGGFKNAGA